MCARDILFIYKIESDREMEKWRKRERAIDREIGSISKHTSSEKKRIKSL